MEKPGMDCGSFRRSRLLISICSFILGFAVFGYAESGPEEPLSVLVETSPDAPQLGDPLRVVVWIDYPDPRDVSLRPSALPAALVLDRVRIEARYPPGELGPPKLWTFVEYLYLSRAAGRVDIGPYEVRIPGKSVRTGSVSFLVLSEPGTAASVQPRLSLRWENLPSAAAPGVPFHAALSLRDGDPSQIEAAVRELRQIAVPERVVWDVLPLSDSDRREGIVARLSLTPLDNRSLVLPSLSLSPTAGNAFLPRVAISLKEGSLPAAASAQAVDSSASIAGSSPKAAVQSTPSFPPLPKPPLLYRIGLFRSEYDRIAELGRGLWLSGDPVAALAYLRENERDSVIGPAFKPIRRALEGALGIHSAPGEPWVPHLLLYALSVFILGLALMGEAGKRLRSRGWKDSPVTSHRRFGYMGVVVFCVLALLGYTAWGTPSLRLRFGFSRTILLRSCEAYRVPEAGSSLSFYGRDANLAWIRGSAGIWAHVETVDGNVGWVPANRIVAY